MGSKTAAVVGHYAGKALDKVSDKVKDKGYEWKNSVEEKIDRSVEKIIIKMSAIGVFVLAGIFLGFAAVYFFQEYAGLNQTISYFIVGLVLAVVGFVLKNK